MGDAGSTIFDLADRDGTYRPVGFYSNYEFVVQISVFGLADNLAYRRTLLCRYLPLYTPRRAAPRRVARRARGGTAEGGAA